MAEIEFVVDFEDNYEEMDIPEDITVANFAIYVDDICLTRNRSRTRSRLSQPSDSVFGPIAGLVDWLIENWAPILWEVQTPFRKSYLGDLGAEKAGVPGSANASDNLKEYMLEDHIYKSIYDDELGVDRGIALLAEESDPTQVADWQHRHLLGHASSDLALPSIFVIPEDRNVVLWVHRLPSRLGPSVDFLIDEKRSIFVIRKTAFSEEVKNFIDKTIERAQLTSKHSHWVDWLRSRWHQAQAQESDSKHRLALMLGEVSASRVGELIQESSALADGVKQLLLDCPIVTQKSDLRPAEEIVREFAIKDDSSLTSNEMLSWQYLNREGISPNQREHSQGYDLAKIVRRKLSLGIKPITDLPKILKRLDVVLENAWETTLFRAAVCAAMGKYAHIIPSARDSRTASVPGFRFTVVSALGRLLWQSRIAGESPICVAQGDHAMLSQSRRANAFAAEFLLPCQAIKGLSPDNYQLWQAAEYYGISRTAARWHAHNVGTGDDGGGE